MVRLLAKHFIEWFLLASVYTVSIVLWLLTVSGSIGSMYQFFPILGVLAWVTMWTQYVVVTTARFGVKSNPHFFQWTGRLTLALIILHPSIFLVQRFLDTGLLPPESYVSYVGPLRSWAIAIAIAAFMMFLLYDFARRFRRQLISRGIWPYISMTQAIAMVAIFIHGLVVGSSTATSYFAVWWWFMGCVLLPCLLLQTIQDFRSLSAKSSVD